ncbi:MAG TPA: hypothetical protein PKA20_02100 [Burkholderiaceae bacterium]|nr:hypothetical protein [Burkholderiaceae bacterium]
MRGIAARGFHSSTLTMVHTATRAPSGRRNAGRRWIGLYGSLPRTPAPFRLPFIRVLYAEDEAMVEAFDFRCREISIFLSTNEN